jgi:hypothetical protein
VFTGQKASVLLSQLALEQNRYLFLRCRVNERQPEIAAVTVRYNDELEGGTEQSLNARATVRFTEDEAVAAKSERADIVAQKELLLTAVAKDTALADADSGRYKQAAVTLNRQAIVLDQQCLNAPASVQSQLRQEAENLRLRASQLEQNQYDSGTRKAMQSESWNARNSK